jgi:hypothetical protein
MRSINELRFRAQRAIDSEESFVQDLADLHDQSIRSLKREQWFLWAVMEVLTERYECWAPHATEVVEVCRRLGK